MEFRGEHLIPASTEEVWHALQDPKVLQGCIEGCDEMTQTSEHEYVASVRAKIGPVRSRFSVQIKMTDIVDYQSYALQVGATGGVAGFGNGRADISLVPEDTSTKLIYEINGVVGGKLAQIGSRLIQGVTNKMAQEFFSKFVKRWSGNSDADN